MARWKLPALYEGRKFMESSGYLRSKEGMKMQEQLHGELMNILAAIQPG
jgi:hypothetical protein